MSGASSTYGESRVEYRFLVGKFEGTRALGKQRRGWKNNIKMDVKEVRLALTASFLFWIRTGGGLL
jgi:hypothetical protein